MSEFLDRLIEMAQTSDCEKRRFAAGAIKNGYILGFEANKRLPSHSFLCENECIRMKIDSGTDSMIGACGHAEERLIWRLGKEAKDCDLYVIQVDHAGVLIPRTEIGFYCARCSTAMAYAKVKGVWIYVVDHFEFMTTQEAIESSYQFALGNKKA